MSHHRSKTVATWLAVVAGPLGLHRFYLYGWRDPVGWLFPLPTLLGLAGLVRLRMLGSDDPAVWVLLPVLGVVVGAAMLCAILYGLMPDERWDARHNGGVRSPATAWAPVLGAIVALLVGGTALMSAAAMTAQKLVERHMAATPH
jgi:hypothetical protein